jgi:starch phosphorylase
MANNRSTGNRAPKNRKCFNFNIENNVEGLKQSIVNHLKYTLGHSVEMATDRDWWFSTAMAIRDRIVERMIRTTITHRKRKVRRAYYLSLEYLMGGLLHSYLGNTGLRECARQALTELGQDVDKICSQEVDMGLGNGGLGRLAACFLDSLASLDLPAIGYGLHYEYGLFKQEFENGHQVEHPDNWLQYTNPWKIIRPEHTQEIPIYGEVRESFDDRGHRHTEWINTSTIKGIPYDIPICGYGANTVNFLRLWESRASNEFDLGVFNQGGYVESVHSKVLTETISKVLYPNDQTENGKELRLVQQYFFVACSLRDIFKRFFVENGDQLENLPSKVAIQLNDTHPAIAVPELMRLLVDEYHIGWDKAWQITVDSLAYTNHTLLPEALEKWSIHLFRKVLPRHLQIIYEINARFLANEVENQWPGDDLRKRALSLIEEGPQQMIRMAYLAVLGSHSTNGVAALHTHLLQRSLFADFYKLFPERFNNKTNGITPRRWLLDANPELSALITEKLGDHWPVHLDELYELEDYAEQPDFQKRFRDIKRRNKERLAKLVKESCGIELNPDAIFDVQIKRLHEYKRQHLNLLHILHLYRQLLDNPGLNIPPRVFIFAAKAAPGYTIAKKIILAINRVAEKINNDSRIDNKLKVVFLPNYSVSLAEEIIPAADVSEQISTAGKEASGTGNMKLALNGALTIGTLDGANVEILEEVGKENIFIFGLTVDEVEQAKANGYSSRAIYQQDGYLASLIDWLTLGSFTPENPEALYPLRRTFLDDNDPWMVLADFHAYCEAQQKISSVYQNTFQWTRMAILNTARMAKFSADRTIHEYAEDIWHLPAVSEIE